MPPARRVHGVPRLCLCDHQLAGLPCRGVDGYLGRRRGLFLQIAQRRRDVLAKTLGYAKDRYEAGYASYLEQIDAQRNLFQAEIDVINLRQSQLDNRIALYRALGGGWQDGAALAASK